LPRPGDNLAQAINRAAFDEHGPDWFQRHEWETLTHSQGCHARQQTVVTQSWDHKADELKTWLAALI
jgi:hypothetical protein